MRSDRPARKTRGGRLTPQRRRLLDRLLDQALEQPLDQRAAFVARCQQRAPRLAFWLERLLAAGSQPTGLVDASASHLVAPALAERTDLFPRTLVRGTRIGPWRILARIGAGGMGEVYHADRADGAFSMEVAIKLIRSRRSNLARLLQTERELLARLNHPAIARLIDGGLAEDGRPYLVMEWAEGHTLGEWIHGRAITPQRCLRVFAQICEAVAFAHRALVVHGDIKPANVAVSRGGQVKLLDFGVAQLLDANTDARMPSALTPGFAAPEQLAGEPVSTSSDIYSLGAVLRWMLFEQTSEDNAQPAGRPARRALWRGFRRSTDLEAVIDQATAASPEKRYPTVNALMLELERLQTERPVKARRLSLAGLAALWVRRRRTTAVVGGLVLALLVGGVSALVWQARIVAKERDVARHEAAVTLAVKDRLIMLFREVSQLSDDGRELSARELLDETAVAAADWLKNDPETLLEIRMALAEILISLDDYTSAEPLLAEAVASLDQNGSPVLRAMLNHNLAMVLHRRGELEEGFERADEAVRLIESFPGDHRERLSNVLQTRARLTRMLGRWEEALADLKRARELAHAAASGPRPMMAWSEANLAATYVIGGEFQKGVEHMQAADALWLALGRGESQDALSNLQNLAVVLDRLGRTDEAIGHFERSIRVRRERFGDSGALAAAMSQYARLLIVRGELDRAEALLDSARSMMARFVGKDSPDYASTLIGHGELALVRDDRQAARDRFAEATEVFRAGLGDGHPYTLLAALGEAMTASGGLDEQASRFADVIERLRSAGPVARSFLAQALCERAVVHLEAANRDAAAQDARECLELRQSLSLGGWRGQEAYALVALALGDQPEAGAAIRALAEEMSAEHPRLRWLEERLDS